MLGRSPAGPGRVVAAKTPPPPGEFKWGPGAQGILEKGIGYGFLNALLYAEDRAKADAPVRGGHRSFLTGSHLGGPLGIQDKPGTKRPKATVGGTLRRSIYASVFVHGAPIAGSRTTDENGKSTAGVNTGGGDVVGILGTNSGYGEWVDQGTSKMPARPFIMPAINLMAGTLSSLFFAGAAKIWAKLPSK